MAEGILNKIVLWGILLLFIFIFFFAFYSKDSGFISKIGKLALSAERFLPVEPSKEVKQDETLPQEAINTQKAFMQEVSQYRDKGECTIQSSGFSGLGNLIMELSNYEGINSRIKKSVGEEGGKSLNHMTTSDTKLSICVINPTTFFNCYLNPTKKDCSFEVHQTYSIIELTKDSIIINRKKFGLAQSLLYKPDKDNVCLIPLHSSFATAPGCDANEDSLDESCIPKIQSNIQMCSQTKMTNSQMCQVMYECFETEGVRRVPPEAYCSQNRPATRMLSEEDCKKVKSCSDPRINLPSKCSLDNQAIESPTPYTLSYQPG